MKITEIDNKLLKSGNEKRHRKDVWLKLFLTVLKKKAY